MGLRWLALGAWLLIGALLWYGVVWRGARGKPSALHLASLPYALLLATTVGFATSLAVQASIFIPLALGAALFLFSDLLVAAARFNNTFFPLIGDVIWLTYGPG